MFAASLLQAVLHADTATTEPDVVLTDRLECEIESALEDGWRPRRLPRAHRRLRACSRAPRRSRAADDAIFRP